MRQGSHRCLPLLTNSRAVPWKSLAEAASPTKYASSSTFEAARPRRRWWSSAFGSAISGRSPPGHPIHALRALVVTAGKTLTGRGAGVAKSPKDAGDRWPDVLPKS